MSSQPSRPRALVLASTYPARTGDGTPSFVRDLAVGISQDFDVLVVVPAVPGAPAREQGEGIAVHRYRYFIRRFEDLAHGAILENVRSRKSRLLQVPFLLIAQAVAVLKAVRTHKPDVIHAHWIIPQGIVARIVAGKIPTVVTTLGGDLYALNDPISRRIKSAVVQRARAVTVMSEDMRQRAIALGADPATTSVKPMGAATAEFAKAAAGHPRTSEGRVELLAVGRMVEKKGFAVLIEALRSIDPTLWHLTMVGDGPLRASLESAAQGLPVTFVGQLGRAELAAADAAAHIAVFPSVRAASGDQDGLPVALLEAMAAGCAVVVSDLPGLTDAVQDGVSGTVIPNGNAVALADAIGELIADVALRERLGAGASERSQAFDVAAVARGYAAVLGAAIESF